MGLFEEAMKGSNPHQKVMTGEVSNRVASMVMELASKYLQQGRQIKIDMELVGGHEKMEDGVTHAERIAREAGKDPVNHEAVGLAVSGEGPPPVLAMLLIQFLENQPQVKEMFDMLRPMLGDGGGVRHKETIREGGEPKSPGDSINDFINKFT